MMRSFVLLRVAEIVILGVILHSDKGLSKRQSSAISVRSFLKRDEEYVSPISGVIEIMKSLGKRGLHHIRIIYCQNYQEELTYIAETLSGDLVGVMFQEYQGNETDLSSVLMQHSAKEGIYLLILCSPNRALDMFWMANNQSLPTHRVSWLLVTEGSKGVGTEVVDVLKTLVHEGTQVTLLVKESNPVYYVFTDRVDSQGYVNFDYEGKWDLDDDFYKARLINHLSYDSRRGLNYDLSDREMIVAAKEATTYFAFGQEYPDGSVEPAAGVEVEVLKSLSSTLNFRYTVMPSKDNFYGNPQSDGNVTGMVGMVARREAHFALSILAITELRNSVIDFSCSYNTGGLQLVSRAPKLKNRTLALLSPFTLQVWMSFIACVLIMGPIMFLETELLQLIHQSNKVHSFESHLFNTFRSLVIQGYRLSDKHWSKKFLLFSWFLFCIIVSALYSGMLTAVLALPSYEKPVDSLHDLPRAIGDGFTLGVLKQSVNEYVFRTATEGIHKKTWELFNHKDRSQSFVDGFDTGLQRVLERKFIFILTDKVAAGFSRTLGSRNFHFGKERFYKLDTGIGCQIGSPFIEKLSIVLMRLVEGGFVVKWEEIERRKIKQTVPDTNVEDIQSSEYPAFGLIHLQAAFFVIIIGFLVSTMSFLLETVSHARLLYKSRNSDTKR